MSYAADPPPAARHRPLLVRVRSWIFTDTERMTLERYISPAPACVCTSCQGMCLLRLVMHSVVQLYGCEAEKRVAKKL